MINGLVLSSYPTLNKLAHSNYIFYLAGSRYFGYPRPDSDYDFFAQFDEKLQNWLRFHQFRRIQMHPSWFDSIAEGIYHHPTGVEVALVTNAKIKKEAQEFIRGRVDLLDTLKVASNDEKRAIWNYAYSNCLNNANLSNSGRPSSTR